MSFPSITNFFYTLFWLCWYTVGYYLGTNPWDRVAERATELDTWFSQLKGWAQTQINNAYDILLDWAQGWFDHLLAWKDYLLGSINGVWSWIATTAGGAVNWVLVYRQTLSDFVTYQLGWLIWFVTDVSNALRYYLGGALDWLWHVWSNFTGWLNGQLSGGIAWLQWFMADPVNVLRWYLGGALDWLWHVWSNFTGWLNDQLAGAIGWLAWFFSDPVGALRYYIGGALDWLWAVASDPLGWVATWLGEAWTYWFNTWSLYKDILNAFLADPGNFILVVLRDIFLDWLEDLIAENW